MDTRFCVLVSQFTSRCSTHARRHASQRARGGRGPAAARPRARPRAAACGRQARVPARTRAPAARGREERDYKGLHAFPSNITRDDPPITRDCPPPLLILQGRSRTSSVSRVRNLMPGPASPWKSFTQPIIIMRSLFAGPPCAPHQPAWPCSSCESRFGRHLRPPFLLPWPTGCSYMPLPPR